MNTIQRVIELADERKLSISQLADICDISYTTLKNAEYRNTQLSVDTVERICIGLQITMSDFFIDWENQTCDATF